VSQYDERGLGRSRAGKSPLADFDAFRARRVAEHEADGYELTAPIYGYAPDYEIPYPGNEYENEPTRLVGSYSPPSHRESASEPTNRGKVRSTVVLAGMVVFVVALGAGVYAATRPSGATQAAGAAAPHTMPSGVVSASSNANGGASASTDPNAGAGMGMGMGSSPSTDPNMGSGMAMGAPGGATPMATQTTKTTARGTLTMLSVIDVGDNAFTAITTRGAAVTVQVTNETQFGTQASPFSPSEILPGAVVMARLRRDTNGDLIATLIYSGANATDPPAATASPSDTTTGNTGDGNGNGSGN
jgi:hypothetical protein